MQTYFTHLRYALVLACWASVFTCTISRGAERPNVLLICVDDLKPVLGCYGDALAKTPNIDRLAQRSLVFDRAYCNQAVCSPSRNALLTSLRPQTLGIYDLATNFRLSRPQAITMPQYFKEHGYHTEAMGKIFHVGHGNHEDEASWSVPAVKPRGVAYARDENKPVAQPAPAGAKKGAAADAPKGAAYEFADVPDETYNDGALAGYAIERLREAKQHPETPFFIAVGFVKPHLPFVAPQKYWDLYDRQAFQPAKIQQPPVDAPAYAPQFGGELRQYRDIPASQNLDPKLQQTLIHGYYAAMSYMDAQVGRVLGELEASGLAKNTIIVFWGDHGWHLGDHGMWCKHTNYEQATRIPLLVSIPGTTSGVHRPQLVESVDVYPTLCELAGLPAPKQLDGKSFAKVVKQADALTKEFVTHVYPRSAQGRGSVLGRAIRTDRYRLVEWKAIGAPADTAELELYDYQEDPPKQRTSRKRSLRLPRS